ncbi:MAG: hypothetical protein AAGF20_00810 [Pseudomonadota bacterium]
MIDIGRSLDHALDLVMKSHRQSLWLVAVFASAQHYQVTVDVILAPRLRRPDQLLARRACIHLAHTFYSIPQAVIASFCKADRTVICRDVTAFEVALENLAVADQYQALLDRLQDTRAMADAA